MEAAEEQLAEQGPSVAETVQASDPTTMYIFIGVVIALVLGMLLMIAGRYRKERKRMAEEGADGFFEDSFEVRDDEDQLTSDGFAEVRIQDTEPFDEDQVAAQYDDETLDDDFGDYREDIPQEEPLTAEADEAYDEEASDDDGFYVDQDEDSDSPNVVPLRSQGEEELSQEVDEPMSRDFDDDEPAPRYAFATGRSAASDNHSNFAANRDVGFGGSAHREPSGYDRYASAGNDRGDDGRPYVAPFIREDIEHAERRQTERLNSLRDDVNRQFETLKSEQSSRLDLVISAIDRKLESLDKRHMQNAQSSDQSETVTRNMTTLGEQVERVSSAIEGQGQRIRAITQILETRFAEVARVHDDVKSIHTDVKSVRGDLSKATQAVVDVRAEMDEVKEHVGRLERAILDRAAQDSSTTHRLADVIRGTLPEDAYTFGASLANGETADCLISFDGIREKIAIDAGFPMEAFHELPSRDAVRRNLPQAKSAEDGFRRAILRSILEAADRCISPAETADSCILFLPSEAAYTILHDRFPDLVRDSQRARVWLVSPSTLMGTLNLIRNLLPERDNLKVRTQYADEDRRRREEEQSLRDEVAALRSRASGLAEELDRTRGTLRDLISTTERLGEESSLKSEDLTSAQHDAEEEMIDSLRFEGTPDWNSPSRDDYGSSSIFDKGRTDTLR